MRALAVLAGVCLAVSACGAAPDGAVVAPDAAPAVVDAFALDRPDDASLDPSDASTPPDAPAALADAPVDARPPLPDADPVRAPVDQWTWVDVPGSACANGRPTGFGINPHANARDVLIFLQGGGACWDGLSCWGPVSTSFYVSTGYGRLEFVTDVARTAMLFMRREAQNPFRDFNLVYVPYCTGDVHAGNRVATYDFFGRRATHHMGARNISLLLPRVVATFPDARRVFLAGDSAGGFGSAFNLARVQEAFPWLRVDVVDDSGPPVQPAGDRWATWARTWGVEIPPECPSCASSIDAFVDHYRTRYSRNRFAVLSVERDAIISTFMGLAPGDFRARVLGLADRADRSWPAARYFVAPGLLHVMQLPPVRPAGFDAWIRRFVDEDPTLRSVRP